jgi:hypothetical protein
MDRSSVKRCSPLLGRPAAPIYPAWLYRYPVKSVQSRVLKPVHEAECNGIHLSTEARTDLLDC